MDRDDRHFLTHRAGPYFGIPALRVNEDYGGDCAIMIGRGHNPVLMLGPKWRAAGRHERRKRLVHELLHVRGLPHDGRARRLGYYSNPHRDRLSSRVYRHLAGGGRRFEPAHFGLEGLR